MDVESYHRALNQGFSERDAVQIGEDAWEDQQMDEATRRRYEDEYYRQMVDLTIDSPCPNCAGELVTDNCSCHLSPPCSNCVDRVLVCRTCAWHSDDISQGDDDEHK